MSLTHWIKHSWAFNICSTYKKTFKPILVQWIHVFHWTQCLNSDSLSCCVRTFSIRYRFTQQWSKHIVFRHSTSWFYLHQQILSIKELGSGLGFGNWSSEQVRCESDPLVSCGPFIPPRKPTRGSLSRTTQRCFCIDINSSQSHANGWRTREGQWTESK